MPFVRLPDGTPVIRCINHEALLTEHDAALEEKTTMRAAPTLMGPWGIDPTTKRIVSAGPGLAVAHALRRFTCCVCLYVELYEAEV